MKIGQTFEHKLTVTNEMLAKNVGSGSVPVYATPTMIAHMEYAAAACVEKSLDEGMVTVGTLVNIKHLAATPEGMKVTVTATLTAAEGRKLTFDLIAHDEADKIGEGTHERFIVNAEKFAEKTAAKLNG